MRQGWLAAGVAGLLSLGLHGAGLKLLTPRTPEALAGAPAQIAMLGNSFEDAAAGTVAAATHPEVVAPVIPATPPVHPAAPTDRAPAPEPADAATPAPAVPVAAAAPALPVTPSAVATPVAPQPAPTPTVAPAPITPVAPTAVASPLPSEPRAAITPPVAAADPAAPAMAAPRAPGVTEAAPLAVPETTPARDGPVVQTAAADTPRPHSRAEPPEPAPPEATAGRRPEPQRPRATPAPPAPKGSAAQPSRAGDATGVAQGTAARTQSGTGGEATSDGRAAAAYPQLVSHHLARQRRPNTQASGGATIAFTVSANGGLVSAAVVRSSGSAELDRLALALVQGAAPFPAPPPGAQRSFQITIRGR
jgi:protein TonB